MSALVGGVAVLERAVAYTLGCLAVVDPAALDRPSPCRSWSLRDLLIHLDDSMAAVQEAADTGRICRTPVRPAGGDDLVLLVRDRAVGLLGSWTSAAATEVRVGAESLTTALVAGAGAIEVTVHGWDIARAGGRPRPIPAELAEELLDLAQVLVRARDRPGRFDPPVLVPPTARPADRLVAFLGRRPVPA